MIKKMLISGLVFLLGNNISTTFNQIDGKIFVEVLEELENLENTFLVQRQELQPSLNLDLFGFQIQDSVEDYIQEELSINQMYNLVDGFYKRLELEFIDFSKLEKRKLFRNILFKLKINYDYRFQYKEFKLNSFRKLLSIISVEKELFDQSRFDLIKLKLMNLFSSNSAKNIFHFSNVGFTILKNKPDLLLDKDSVVVEFNELIVSLIDLLSINKRVVDTITLNKHRKRLFFD